jgi:hypothetical protein
VQIKSARLAIVGGNSQGGPWLTEAGRPPVYGNSVGGLWPAPNFIARVQEGTDCDTQRAIAGSARSQPARPQVQPIHQKFRGLYRWVDPKPSEHIIEQTLATKPISHILGKEEAGLDGNNLLAGIEAMNGPGHASIPVRRTQLQRAASDKPVTP